MIKINENLTNFFFQKNTIHLCFPQEGIQVSMKRIIFRKKSNRKFFVVFLKLERRDLMNSRKMTNQLTVKSVTVLKTTQGFFYSTCNQ